MTEQEIIELSEDCEFQEALANALKIIPEKTYITEPEHIFEDSMG